MDDVINLESKKKDNKKTDEEKDVFENKIFCCFCKKSINFGKVRNIVIKKANTEDLKFRIVLKTQKQCIFIPFVIHNFSKHACQLIFKSLVDQKREEENFDVFRKAYEEKISVTYGCFRSIVSYRFLSSIFDSPDKSIVEK